MNLKERLISGLHNQKDALETLITRLKSGDELTSRDCYLYEVTTKEVEKELKRLRRLALDELIREITKPELYLNREEILE